MVDQIKFGFIIVSFVISVICFGCCIDLFRGVSQINYMIMEIKCVFVNNIWCVLFWID